MRSRLTLPFALAIALFGLVAACDIGEVANLPSASEFAPLDAAYELPMADAGDAGEEAAVDASAAALSEGSPLCNASHAAGCYPDDPSTAQTCGRAPDGGPFDPDAGYDDVLLACHVEPMIAGNVVESMCAPAGSGIDGAACQRSDDCAAGFECVGSGMCRHYCCAGNTSCGGHQFCDIQPMATASTTEVPVCMPIGGCELLDAAACPAEETCAVVRDDGTTSCVAVGDAKAGASCDTQHCGQNLVCLGIPGERRCYQLCHTATAAECSSTAKQTCNASLPLFPDPAIGICE